MRILTFVVAVVLGLLVGSYAQTPGPEVVRGRSFVLLDGEGHKRGEWLVDDSGRAVLRMYDAKGTLIWNSAGGVQLLSH
jgi:hypothetical protein